MESNRFFIFINRFNAIAFMFILVAAAASIIYFTAESSNWRDRRAVTVDEKPGSDKKIDLVLSGIERVDGAQASFVELREKEDKGYSSGGGYGATRNILFFNDNSIAPKWLLDKNEYLINRVIQLKTKAYSEKEPTIAILYLVIHEDSDKNHKLNEYDKITISLSKSDGTNLTPAISKVDSYIDYKISEDRKSVDFIYQYDQKIFVERLSLDTFTSLAKQEISQIGSI